MMAAKPIVCHEQRMPVARAKGSKGPVKCSAVFIPYLFRQHCLFRAPGGNVKVGKIEFEHAHAPVVPVLERSHEVFQIGPFEQGGARSVPVQRRFPGATGANPREIEAMTENHSPGVILLDLHALSSGPALLATSVCAIAGMRCFSRTRTASIM